MPKLNVIVIIFLVSLISPISPIPTLANTGAVCAWCVPQQYGYAWGGFPYAQNPWWGYYGSFSYPNYYYPGPWAGWGINGGYYPGGEGGGTVGLAKPNLYISGPPGTKVNVKLNLPSDTTWLVSVPPHRDGWSFTLEKGGLIKGTSASYRYAYYDLRVKEEKLQDLAGKCFEKSEEVLAWMKKYLKNSSFHTNEINDFEEHWSQKIPPSKKYCVFPQENEQLDSVAPLQIEPAPSAIKRIVFVVSVGEAMEKKLARRFTKPPKEEWKSSQRAPSSKESDGISVREWGVGFLMTD